MRDYTVWVNAHRPKHDQIATEIAMLAIALEVA